MCVRVSRRIHICTVSGAMDEQGLDSGADVLHNAQSMPRVNRTIRKDNIGPCNVPAPIEGVGAVDCTGDVGRHQTKQPIAHVRVIRERHAI